MNESCGQMDARFQKLRRYVDPELPLAVGRLRLGRLATQALSHFLIDVSVYECLLVEEYPTSVNSLLAHIAARMQGQDEKHNPFLRVCDLDPVLSNGGTGPREEQTKPTGRITAPKAGVEPKADLKSIEQLFDARGVTLHYPNKATHLVDDFSLVVGTVTPTTFLVNNLTTKLTQDQSSALQDYILNAVQLTSSSGFQPVATQWQSWWLFHVQVTAQQLIPLVTQLQKQLQPRSTKPKVSEDQYRSVGCVIGNSPVFLLHGIGPIMGTGIIKAEHDIQPRDSLRDSRHKDDNVSKISALFQLLMPPSKTVLSPNLSSFMLTNTENFTFKALEQCWSKSQENRQGLLSTLWPFMIDQLKRCQTFASMTDYEKLQEKTLALYSTDDDDDYDLLRSSVPKEFFDYTNKDLIIALLEYSDVELHSRLISSYSATGLAVPVAYQCFRTDRVLTTASFEGLVDILCSPKGILATSCGTSSATNVGKTDLLSRLLSLPDTALERHPGGVFHALSVDMVFGTLGRTNYDVVAADVHEFDIHNQGFLTVVSLLLSASFLVIFHVTASDFDANGTPLNEIKKMIQIASNTQFCHTKVTVFLWRDFDEKKHHKLFDATKNHLQVLCKQFEECQHNPPVSVIPIPNLEKFKRERVRIREKIATAIKKMLDDCDSVSPIPNVRTMAETLQKNAEKHQQLPRDFYVTQCCPSSADTSLFCIQRTVHSHLDKALKQSSTTSLSQRLFPFSEFDSQMARLNEEASRLARHCLNDKTQQDIYNIKQKQENVKNQKTNNAEPSEFVKYFASLVQQTDTSLIQEFQRQLNAWKSPKCEEPLKKRKDLHVEMEAKLSELQQKGRNPELDSTFQTIKQKIKENTKELDQFDISIDDVWSELMSMAEVVIDISCRTQETLLKKHCGLDPKELQNMYRKVVLNGHPIQLLRGYPLYMASDFLSQVLRGIPESDQSRKKLFVVSVIGPQSSAKSTLLNYLFGCGFQTQAGRCTKGLYVSLARSPDIDVLVLDSEGLMSVEADSPDFDNTVTLMAAACSHVVIINQKGEILRQLQQLLGVVVFALKHLQVLDLKPYVWFVLRDQAHNEPAALKDQFLSMNQVLKKETERLDIEVNKFINLSPESVHLLSSAYDMQKIGHRRVKIPSELFSDEIVDLRSKLFRLYKEKFQDTSSKIGAFLSMHDWLMHVRTVWDAVQKFGSNLTHYESMHEIEQRKEVSEAYRDVLEKYIEGDDGYDAYCDKLLDKQMSLSAKETVHGTASQDLKNDLQVSVAKTSKEVVAVLEAKLELGTYPAKMINEFNSKLILRVEETKKGVLAAWKQHVARKQGEAQMDDIQTTLEQNMDAHINAEKGETMNRAELEKLFDSGWKECMETTEESIRQSMLTPQDIESSVNHWIHDDVTAHPGEPVYVTLTTLVSKTPAEKELIIMQPAELFKKYIRAIQAPSRWYWLPFKHDRIPKIKKWGVTQVYEAVHHHFNELDKHYSSSIRWKPDSAYCARQVDEAVSMIVTVQQVLHARQESNIEIELETKQFSNDVLDCLRRWIIDRWVQKQKEEMDQRLEGLKANESRIKAKIVNRLTCQEGDQSRSTELANTVRDKLTDWIEKTILQSSVRLKRELRKNLDSSQAAAQHAYDESFGKENWTDVVAYCTNASEYLHRVFEKRFDWIAVDMKLHDLAPVKQQIGNFVGKLKEVTKSWGELPEHESQTKDKITTAKFMTFVAPRLCSSIAGSSSSRQVFETLIPDDVEISNPRLFTRLFLKELDSSKNCEEVLYDLAEQRMNECLAQAKCDAWDIAKGCPETCPFCKAKCSLEKDHLALGIKHECDVHILPALGGTTTYQQDGKELPTFNRCTSEIFINGPKSFRNKPETERPNLAEFYKDFCPNWRVPDCVPPVDNSVHDTQQRKAWVNCRAPLLKRYDFMTDDTPDDWIQRYEKNPLD